MTKIRKYSFILIFLLLYFFVLNYNLSQYLNISIILNTLWLLLVFHYISNSDHSSSKRNLILIIVFNIVFNTIILVNLNFLKVYVLLASFLLCYLYYKINLISKIKLVDKLFIALSLLLPFYLNIYNTEWFINSSIAILLNFLLMTFFANKYLGNQINIVLNNNYLIGRDTFEKQLEIAKNVQRNLLPSKDSIRNAQIYLKYEPFWQVGGDFCNVFELGKENNYVIVIGDVVGKGLAAGLIMTELVTNIKALINYKNTSVSQVVKKLNKICCSENITDHTYYATTCLIQIDIDKMELEICNAGHEPPYLFRNKEKKLEKIEKHTVMLGVNCDKIEFEKSTYKLNKGDLLVLYTDGLLNIIEGSLDSLLKECFNKKDFNVLRCISTKIENFDKNVTDDYLILIIEFGGI